MFVSTKHFTTFAWLLVRLPWSLRLNLKLAICNYKPITVFSCGLETIFAPSSFFNQCKVHDEIWNWKLHIPSKWEAPTASLSMLESALDALSPELSLVFHYMNHICDQMSLDINNSFGKRWNNADVIISSFRKNHGPVKMDTHRYVQQIL